MSVTKNHVFSTWKIVVDSLRRQSFVRNQKALNKYQSKIWYDALCLMAMAWIDLSNSSLIPTPRWLIPWLRFIASTDVTVLVETLKAADKLLIDTRSSFSNYENFKHSLSDGGFAASIYSPMKKLIDEWYLYRDPLTFSRLHNAFTFITRVNLPDLDDLKQAAYADYLANESRISLPYEYTKEEATVIADWFPAKNSSHLYDGWAPKHGPGSVADIKDDLDKLKKYLNGGSDDMIRMLDLRLGGQSQYTFSNRLERVSRVVFVPKSIDKLRTICMEPSTLQWYQQGFMHSILEEIRDTPLRRRINLESQEYSRELCYEGSLDGKLSTIDLSNASDSVTFRHVVEWFRRSSLLAPCVLTRSRVVELPRGQRIRSNKFAPMGSALCFPIECIVFAAIVECSIQECGGSVRDSQYRVYGDDIIVETKYAPTVMRRLERNGFLVNTKKSFYTIDTVNYRESCGAEFLNGVDVTPVRLPRNFARTFRDNGSVYRSSAAVAVTLCNSFYSKLPSVRRVLIKGLLALPKEQRPAFDNSGEKGLFSPNPTNFHLPKPKYRKRYQNLWLTHGAPGLSKEDREIYKLLHLDESVALYDTLNEIAKRYKDLNPEKPYFAALNRKPRPYWTVTKSCIDSLYTHTDDEVIRKGS